MKAENDGRVISVRVGGKQDDRLLSAVTVFLYLLREMTRRGQAVELAVGKKSYAVKGCRLNCSHILQQYCSVWRRKNNR